MERSSSDQCKRVCFELYAPGALRVAFILKIYENKDVAFVGSEKEKPQTFSCSISKLQIFEPLHDAETCFLALG